MESNCCLTPASFNRIDLPINRARDVALPNGAVGIVLVQLPSAAVVKKVITVVNHLLMLITSTLKAQSVLAVRLQIGFMQNLYSAATITMRAIDTRYRNSEFKSRTHSRIGQERR